MAYINVTECPFCKSKKFKCLDTQKGIPLIFRIYGGTIYYKCLGKCKQKFSEASVALNKTL